MLTYNDTIRFAGEWTSEKPIDPDTVAQLLKLMIQTFQLAIAIMLVVTDVLNTLDAIGESIAVTFWRGWDNFMAGLRWQLCPVRVMPIG